MGNFSSQGVFHTCLRRILKGEPSEKNSDTQIDINSHKNLKACDNVGTQSKKEDRLKHVLRPALYPTHTYF